MLWGGGQEKGKQHADAPFEDEPFEQDADMNMDDFEHNCDMNEDPELELESVRRKPSSARAQNVVCTQEDMSGHPFAYSSV
ncbi:hypothetical protein PAXRUDRAFT_15056 [Paxillus rubicundulus Ve08.2h10]|uniref:Uncharacterized protein n=1 Tax=Paxillus rubicundulus Ve08.2h10 TaxID=930991 RepID=A0A0D0DQQ6_9AGAM|nr:hypothetical protein PAXRUDRAFT_15056 [Paxillus rubicundulus Ve08.2h10]